MRGYSIVVEAEAATIRISRSFYGILGSEAVQRGLRTGLQTRPVRLMLSRHWKNS